MATVVRLDPHHLVLVIEVQRPVRVGFDGEMEHRRARLELVEQILVVDAVVCGDEVCPAEPKLRWTAAGDEDRRVVDGDGDDLFVGEDQVLVP